MVQKICQGHAPSPPPPTSRVLDAPLQSKVIGMLSELPICSKLEKGKYKVGLDFSLNSNL